MDRKSVLNLFSKAFVIILYFSNVLCSYKANKHKNVLILFADDMGRESSVYNNTVCQTPNLQRLSKRSTIFVNAFTSVSSCSPSRATLLSGLPAHQNGMYGLHHDIHHFDSFDQIQSLSTILRNNGIRTGIIGKKHVGPENVYPFEFAYTEENNSILQVGRNITHIKNLVNSFLNGNNGSQFFLYVAFHDPHRCGHTQPQYGNFCENFGNGEKGMGVIPDWKPYYYNESDIIVPYYLPDNKIVRNEIAAQYTTIGRLDQGVGLIFNELKIASLLDTTLVIFSSDNGPPFPSGRTNFYDPGITEPLLVSNPLSSKMWAKEIFNQVSLLDVLPTVLDWFNIPKPSYKLFGKNVSFTGRSLLTYTYKKEIGNEEKRAVYGSHAMHELTMFYPMRYIRTKYYKLIQNINYWSPYPIDQDLYVSPTFLDILNKTQHSIPLHWYKNLTDYYYRPEWEMFDLITDPFESNNIYNSLKSNKITKKLKKMLFKWRNETNDPFLCSPHSVLQNQAKYKLTPKCLPLYNKK